MKRFTLITTFILITTNVIFSQTVNNIPLKDIDVEFVQIVGTSKFMSTKLTIELDFGQYNNAWTRTDTQLYDEKGTKIIFNSMIDALNFMTKHGYFYVDSHTITIGNQNVYHFILQKRKKEEENK